MIIILSVFCSCTSKKPIVDSNNHKLTYSNLVDKASQLEVRVAMEVSNLNQKNIDDFFNEVDNFNQTVKNTSLVKEGFITINSLEPEYNLVEMVDLWNAKYPEFIGYNCRLTTFDLIKDKITINTISRENSDWLVFDKDAINNNPKDLFTKNEYNDFLTLYSHIPTDNSNDINVHLKSVTKAIEVSSIEFIDLDTLSLISVLFHDEDGYLFVGHTGVLLKTLEDKYIFVEKLSFQAPYQASKFDNKLELNDYLMNKYDISWNQDTAIPFIMENDQLLEGYRENIISKKHQ